MKAIVSVGVGFALALGTAACTKSGEESTRRESTLSEAPRTTTEHSTSVTDPIEEPARTTAGRPSGTNFDGTLGTPGSPGTPTGPGNAELDTSTGRTAERPSDSGLTPGANPGPHPESTNRAE